MLCKALCPRDFTCLQTSLSIQPGIFAARTKEARTGWLMQHPGRHQVYGMSTCVTCSSSYLNAAGHHQCPQCTHNWKKDSAAAAIDAQACAGCARTLPTSAYSKTQLKRSEGASRRCKVCIAGDAAVTAARAAPHSGTQGRRLAAVPLPASSKGPYPKRQRETSPPRPVPQAGRNASSTSPPRDPRPAHLQEAEPQPKWRRPLEHGGGGPSRAAVEGPQRKPPERTRPSDDASGTSGARLAKAEATSTELRAQLERLVVQLSEVTEHAGERTQAAVRAAKQQAAAELTRARQLAVDAGRSRLLQAEKQAKAWERQAAAAASTNEQLRQAVLEKSREAEAERNEAVARQREAAGATAKLALLRGRDASRERHLRAELAQERDAEMAAAATAAAAAAAAAVTHDSGRRIAADAADAAAADVARREARLRELKAAVLSRVGAAEAAAAAAMRQLEEAEARAAQRAQLEAGRSRLEVEVATLRADAARRRGEAAERCASVPSPQQGRQGGRQGGREDGGEGAAEDGEELCAGEVRRARGLQLSFGDALLVWEQNHHTARELPDAGT